MDFRVVLLMTICIQALLAAPLSSSDDEGYKEEPKGPLTEDQKERMAKNLENLKNSGEELKKQMQKLTDKYPGLDKMTDALVDAVYKEVAGFTDFNIKRRADPNNKSPFTRYRKSFDSLKDRHYGFLDTLRDTFGQKAPQAKTPSLPSASPHSARRSSCQGRYRGTPPRVRRTTYPFGPREIVGPQEKKPENWTLCSQLRVVHLQFSINADCNLQK
ncbi:unnamed protein product [Bemisia tabaci]|uniref:Uncharacterized protein n=1 Tax=Bemisia tabaci TaxID=7038 RepID=A0A9P0ADB6_BEMTA|nr:unnamed protein product [Bemisia tabaci]